MEGAERLCWELKNDEQFGKSVWSSSDRFKNQTREKMEQIMIKWIVSIVTAIYENFTIKVRFYQCFVLSLLLFIIIFD